MNLGRRIVAAALAAGIGVLAGGVAAQSLSPEEIKAMVDQRVNALNPYQALLNDPDPARSLGAMQIMLESGDKELIRMALEFGLLSPSAAVKRAAFESYLASGPIFSIRFDGSEIKDSDYDNRMRNDWNGNLQPDRTGYWRIGVGAFLPEKKCYASTSYDNECFVTVNADGIFLTPRNMSARGLIGDDGVLAGFASLAYVDQPAPFVIQLLD